MMIFLFYLFNFGLKQTLRMKDSKNNFFNGGLADRHLSGLKHFMRASFTAHTQYAVVSRGCPSCCTQINHAYCWPQLISHPAHWWWWTFCVPLTSPISSG